MLKTILLAGTMAIAAPALAQTQAPAMQTAPAATQAPAAPATSTAMPAPSQPAAVSAQGTPAPAQTPAAASTQVAQVVDQQFGTYDKDGNGALSKAEFSAWMTALKTQANAKEADAAKETAWNDAAFKQADGDRSSTVSKVELTGFLVKGASGAS